MNYAQIYSDWVKGGLLTELKPEQRRALPLIVSGAASEEQLAAAGAAFVVGVKEAARLQTRSTVAGPVERARTGEHVIPWVLSDASSDRMGDVISADGWRLDNFRKNPVIMWGHGGGGVLDGDEPIGRAEKVRVEKGKLVADIRFAVEESDRAARKFRLANSGYIKAGSVGFKPIKVERVEDEDERRKLGLGKFGVLYKEQELLEFSLVAVPANPHALQQSVKAGEIEAGDADWLASEAATSTSTERDLERSARRKAAALEPAPMSVVLPESTDDAEGLRKLNELLRGRDEATVRLMLEPLAALRSEHARTAERWEKIADIYAKALRDSDETLHALAASHAMLAKAITDLGGCLGALRVTDVTPSADAGRSSNGTGKDGPDLLAIMQALRKLKL